MSHELVFVQQCSGAAAKGVSTFEGPSVPVISFADKLLRVVGCLICIEVAGFVCADRVGMAMHASYHPFGLGPPGSRSAQGSEALTLDSEQKADSGIS